MKNTRKPTSAQAKGWETRRANAAKQEVAKLMTADKFVGVAELSKSKHPKKISTKQINRIRRMLDRAPSPTKKVEIFGNGGSGGAGTTFPRHDLLANLVSDAITLAKKDPKQAEQMLLSRFVTEKANSADDAWRAHIDIVRDILKDRRDAVIADFMVMAEAVTIANPLMIGSTTRLALLEALREAGYHGQGRGKAVTAIGTALNQAKAVAE